MLNTCIDMGRDVLCKRRGSESKEEGIRIIVPTARQGRSQGENGNVDRFLMPRDSFTFRGRNEEGQLSNRAEHLSARAKRGKTAQRS